METFEDVITEGILELSKTISGISHGRYSMIINSVSSPQGFLTFNTIELFPSTKLICDFKIPLLNANGIEIPPFCTVIWLEVLMFISLAMS